MSAMARSHVARFVAAAFVTGAATLPTIALSGQAAVAGSRPSAPLSLTVTSVTPSYASPGETLTIRGSIANSTSTSLSGVSIRLLSSTVPFSDEASLEQFTAGTYPIGGPVSGLGPLTISRLRGKQSVNWQLKLPVNDLQLSCFGVYPLTITASNAAQTVTRSSQVPLPFWPRKASSCPGSARPQPFPISWVWPLIDSPHQGPCPGLLDNWLAASLAPGGRLANLVSVGGAHSRKARLTWAIDPALLGSASTMTARYQVGDSARCSQAKSYPADPHAKTWLADVARATAGQPVFVTPYADVDLAGLAQYGNSTDLRNAFLDGQRLAAPLLGRKPVPVHVPAGQKQFSAVAWPANGLANPAMLENLGAMHVGTVILAMPSSQPGITPGAVTSVNDGVGTRLKVLLADSTLSRLLASRAVSDGDPGSIFQTSQMFLAQTAMIVAEAPATLRPIMVTPPRRWNPNPTLAGDLLTDTSAPWLRPATVGELARQPAQPDVAPIVQPQAGGELPRKLLHEVMALDGKVALLASIMVEKDQNLSRAVYSIESDRWVGKGVPQAQAMLKLASKYVSDQFAKLSIGGKQALNVTLGGRNGSVTLSVRNNLSYTVVVGLQVRSSNDTVVATQRSPQAVYTVGPHSSTPLKLSVNATQTGKATLRLRLKSPTGALLPDQPLTMNISVTNLGTVALGIFAAALIIFVIASAAQAIRRHPRTDDDPEAPGEPGAELSKAGSPNEENA
jgi:hypothetical protein